MERSNGDLRVVFMRGRSIAKRGGEEKVFVSFVPGDAEKNL